MNLKISEIFYSLQGEGLRTGAPSVFIRVQGCKTKDACFAGGVMCDTEFESGKQMSVQEIIDFISKYTCKEIVWTGGEPAGQLTNDIVSTFKELGYYQCIETSGLLPIPTNLDFVTLSPKVAEHVVKKNFTHVTELKYVRHIGQSIPQPSVKADNYFISPHNNGKSIDNENLQYCIQLCLENPQWKLTTQYHKIWKML